jgi:hypothetical protein
MGPRKNWLVAWHFPALDGSVQHSLSPMIADRRSMIKKGYAPQFGSPWSILLTLSKFHELRTGSTGWTGTVAAYEACLRTTGCHRPRHPMNSGLSIPRAGAVSSGFDCNVAPSAAKVAAIPGPDNFKAFGNAFRMCVPSVRLRKPGYAGFSAIGTPKIFSPVVEDDHPSIMSPRRDGSSQ